MEHQTNNSGLNRHKLKLTILIIYILGVLGTPFLGHIPLVHDYFKRNAEPFIPANADSVFRQYIHALKAGDSRKTLSLMAPDAASEMSSSSLTELRSILASTTDNVAGITLHTDTVAGQGTYLNAVYEIENNDPNYKYIRGDISAIKTNDGIVITNGRLTQEVNSIIDQNPYNAARQTPLWVVAFALPLLIGFTGLRYIRKAQKPNWIVFLIILLGSFYIILFYRNGYVTPGLNVGIFTATYKNAFGYYYMIPIPIGAVYYWIRRRHYEVVDDNKAASLSFINNL
jgi:hypothetical protein